MRWTTLFVLLMTISGCAGYEPVEKMPGVASVASRDDGVAVRLNDVISVRERSGDEVVLRAGEETWFGDGHHFSIFLRYVGMNDGRQLFRHTTYHRPPSAAVQETIRCVRRFAIEPES